MAKTSLRNILSKLSGKTWNWNYRIEHDNGISAGSVEVSYIKDYIAIKWNKDKLKAILGNYPPLSFSEREVVDFEDNQNIITANKWKIYLDV